MGKLPVFDITIDPEYSEGEDLGIEQIAFTSKPAILVKGMAFTSDVKPMAFKDDVKMRIAAPAMIPMNIYRREEDGKEYEVKFSVEEIEAIYSKFMSGLSNKDKFNLEHDTAKKVPAYILEAWIVEEPKEDKAYTRFGVEVPKGSVFIVSQITDREYYNQLVENEQVGYSIEGFLGMKISNSNNQDKMNKKEKLNEVASDELVINGKVYIVKEKFEEEPKEEELAEEPKEEELAEEVKEEVKEEVVMEDEPTEGAPKPATEEFVTAQIQQLLEALAEMEVRLMEGKEVAMEDKQEEVKMSVADFKMSQVERIKQAMNK
jgi:hypothetical protein